MWWDEDTDSWFKEFIRDLFTSSVVLSANIQRNPVNQGVMEAANKVGGKVGAITSGQEQRTLGTPSPVPEGPYFSPTPSPTTSGPQPAASPVPSPVPSPSRSGLPDYVDKSMTDQEILNRAAGDPPLASTQKQGAIGGVDPNAPVYEERRGKRDRADIVAAKRTGELSGASKEKVDSYNLRTLGEVSNEPYAWDDEQFNNVVKLMKDAGYIGPNAVVDRMGVASIWAKFAATSALMYQQGKKVSPMTLLKNQSHGLAGQTGRGPKTVSSTDTSYTVTNATTARQLAQAALSQRVGRKATDEEVTSFIEALRAEEKANPQVSRQTTTTNADGTSQTSTSTVKQGVNVNAFADSYAMDYDTEEAKAYQAAGVMMPWFWEALRTPG